ncbi:hypothetical protein SISSUDRAFT_1037455 [Sistotremastrum suecicum HHB10207 ss-3]|uniref:Uncharacterized protein n=1 Tax=Sistotremastrum suecicum HHB10207 ss-3 TaxID=1314776 RepID=A0A165Y3W4_9AGAM|nr:hypothetical protein SISSUDRAFT_1037455 [Sistotremastrum suecicum HHB10207 ss-3]
MPVASAQAPSIYRRCDVQVRSFNIKTPLPGDELRFNLFQLPLVSVAEVINTLNPAAHRQTLALFVTRKLRADNTPEGSGETSSSGFMDGAKDGASYLAQSGLRLTSTTISESQTTSPHGVVPPRMRKKWISREYRRLCPQNVSQDLRGEDEMNDVFSSLPASKILSSCPSPSLTSKRRVETRYIQYPENQGNNCGEDRDEDIHSGNSRMNRSSAPEIRVISRQTEGLIVPGVPARYSRLEMYSKNDLKAVYETVPDLPPTDDEKSSMWLTLLAHPILSPSVPGLEVPCAEVRGGELWYTPNAGRVPPIPGPNSLDDLCPKAVDTSPLWWSTERPWIPFIPTSVSSGAGEKDNVWWNLFGLPSDTSPVAHSNGGTILSLAEFLQWDVTQIFIELAAATLHKDCCKIYSDQGAQLLLKHIHQPATFRVSELDLSDKTAHEFYQIVDVARASGYQWAGYLSFYIALSLYANAQEPTVSPGSSDPATITPRWLELLRSTDVFPEKFVSSICSSTSISSFTDGFRSGAFFHASSHPPPAFPDILYGTQSQSLPILTLSPPGCSRLSFSLDFYRFFHIPIWYCWGRDENQAAKQYFFMRRYAPTSGAIASIAADEAYPKELYRSSFILFQQVHPLASFEQPTTTPTRPQTTLTDPPAPYPKGGTMIQIGEASSRRRKITLTPSRPISPPKDISSFMSTFPVAPPPPCPPQQQTARAVANCISVPKESILTNQTKHFAENTDIEDQATGGSQVSKRKRTVVDAPSEMESYKNSRRRSESKKKGMK